MAVFKPESGTADFSGFQLLPTTFACQRPRTAQQCVVPAANSNRLGGRALITIADQIKRREAPNVAVDGY
jgi:hypothetical protein